MACDNSLIIHVLLQYKAQVIKKSEWLCCTPPQQVDKVNLLNKTGHSRYWRCNKSAQGLNPMLANKASDFIPVKYLVNKSAKL